jgi:hypothetical protein
LRRICYNARQLSEEAVFKHKYKLKIQTIKL